MDEATAAVSWGPDRIDLFWVDAAGALVHRASAWRRLGCARVARRHAGFGAGRDGLGRRSAPGLRRSSPTAQLWNRYWDGEAWHPWESLGGELHWHPGRILVGRRSHRRLGARHGRHDLAPLVGRHALGRVGAPPPLIVGGRGPASAHRTDDRVDRIRGVGEERVGSPRSGRKYVTAIVGVQRQRGLVRRAGRFAAARRRCRPTSVKLVSVSGVDRDQRVEIAARRVDRDRHRRCLRSRTRASDPFGRRSPKDTSCSALLAPMPCPCSGH